MKLTATQLRVLSELVTRPGGRTTAFIFNGLCANPKTVRALFEKNAVEGDGFPATYVCITPAGRAALEQPKEK